MARVFGARLLQSAYSLFHIPLPNIDSGELCQRLEVVRVGGQNGFVPLPGAFDIVLANVDGGEIVRGRQVGGVEF